MLTTQDKARLLYESRCDQTIANARAYWASLTEPQRDTILQAFHCEHCLAASMLSAASNSSLYPLRALYVVASVGILTLQTPPSTDTTPDSPTATPTPTRWSLFLRFLKGR